MFILRCLASRPVIRVGTNFIVIQLTVRKKSYRPLQVTSREKSSLALVAILNNCSYVFYGRWHRTRYFFWSDVFRWSFDSLNILFDGISRTLYTIDLKRVFFLKTFTELAVTSVTVTWLLITIAIVVYRFVSGHDETLARHETGFFSNDILCKQYYTKHALLSAIGIFVMYA